MLDFENWARDHLAGVPWRRQEANVDSPTLVLSTDAVAVTLTAKEGAWVAAVITMNTEPILEEVGDLYSSPTRLLGVLVQFLINLAGAGSREGTPESLVFTNRVGVIGHDIAIATGNHNQAGAIMEILAMASLRVDGPGQAADLMEKALDYYVESGQSSEEDLRAFATQVGQLRLLAQAQQKEFQSDGDGGEDDSARTILTKDSPLVDLVASVLGASEIFTNEDGWMEYDAGGYAAFTITDHFGIAVRHQDGVWSVSLMGEGGSSELSSWEPNAVLSEIVATAYLAPFDALVGVFDGDKSIWEHPGLAAEELLPGQPLPEAIDYMMAKTVALAEELEAAMMFIRSSGLGELTMSRRGAEALGRFARVFFHTETAAYAKSIAGLFD